MKILVLAPYIPAPPDTGGRRRIHALLTRLGRTNEVTLAAFVGAATPRRAIDETRKMCERLVAIPNPALGAPVAARRKMQLRSIASRWSYETARHRTPDMQRAIDRVARDTQFDLTLVEFAQMAEYELPRGTPAVLDAHNVEYDIVHRTYRSESGVVRKFYSYLEYLKLRREEQRAWARMDVCVFTSERDADVARAALPEGHFCVIPNGVDTREFVPAGNERGADILFFGADFYPNIDGLRFYADEVLPLVRRERPSARLVVVGSAVRALGDRARDGVVAIGPVDDLRPYIQAAAVVVAPLRIGGGTRLKILEAMATAKPVVATRIGAEGIDAIPGRDLLIADDPAGLARATCEVLSDDLLAFRLGAHARRLVEQRYDWDVLVTRLDRVLRTLVAPRRTYRIALSREKVG
jgi:glycosyltransferase involved in cell wall biosynthesis